MITNYPIQRTHRVVVTSEDDRRTDGFYARATVYRKNSSKRSGYIGKHYGFGKCHDEAVADALADYYGWLSEFAQPQKI